MSDRITMRWACTGCKHASEYTVNSLNRDVEYDTARRPWVTIYSYPFELAGPMVDRSEADSTHTTYLYACPVCGTITNKGYEIAVARKRGRRANANQTADLPTA